MESPHHYYHSPCLSLLPVVQCMKVWNYYTWTGCKNCLKTSTSALLRGTLKQLSTSFRKVSSLVLSSAFTVRNQAVTHVVSQSETRQLHIQYHCQKPGSYTYTITVRNQAVTHVVSQSETRQLHIWYHC